MMYPLLIIFYSYSTDQGIKPVSTTQVVYFGNPADAEIACKQLEVIDCQVVRLYEQKI